MTIQISLAATSDEVVIQSQLPTLAPSLNPMIATVVGKTLIFPSQSMSTNNPSSESVTLTLVSASGTYANEGCAPLTTTSCLQLDGSWTYLESPGGMNTVSFAYTGRRD